MANYINGRTAYDKNIQLKRSIKILKQLSLKPVPNIDSFSDEQLEEHKYYQGFPCPHNHTIRSFDTHHCYHCVQKIFSNNCGFNINLLHFEYKIKYMRLWNQVEVGDWNKCWDMTSAGKGGTRRVCVPSYRSLYSHQKSENFSFHKAIYHCAWGDVGTFTVTHVCGNKRCANPLHLVSSWNRKNMPSTVSPFVIDFRAEELMMFNKSKLRSNIQELIRKDMRPTISHPLDVPENTEYNE